MSRSEIEAAIDADPDDVRAYEVYADYLQDHGDPRGQLIALAIAAETNRALTPDERDFLDANQAALLPPAWIAQISKLWPSLGSSIWRWGCFRRVRAGQGSEEVFEDLLAHPAGRFVVELHLEHGIDLARVLASIVAKPRLATRELAIGIGDRRTMGGKRIDADLSGLWAVVPRLASLSIVGFDARFGVLELPALVSLVLDATTLEPAYLEMLHHARIPSLERLELGIGRQRFDQVFELLASLLDGDRFPRLRELALLRTNNTQAIVDMLARSPLLRRLGRLSLRGGSLADAEAVRRHPAFAHLAELDLSSYPGY